MAKVSRRPSVPVGFNMVHNNLTKRIIPYNVRNVIIFVIRGWCRSWLAILIQRVHRSVKRQWLVINVIKSLIETVVVKFSRR